MVKKHKYNQDKHLYLVEGNNVVTPEKTGCIDIPQYKKKITIDELEKELDKFGMRKKELFPDIFVYTNKKIEITVVLYSEDQYYEAELYAKEIDIGSYTKQVANIDIQILTKITKLEFDVIGMLMKKFRLNAYHIVTNRHYKNIGEIKKHEKCRV